MRRSATEAFVAILLSWILIYPSVASADNDDQHKSDPAAKLATKTPIKHLVVIFDENISFDHYFGTYPNALNLPGEPRRFIQRRTLRWLTDSHQLCSATTRTR